MCILPLGFANSTTGSLLGKGGGGRGKREGGKGKEGGGRGKGEGGKGRGAGEIEYTCKAGWRV